MAAEKIAAFWTKMQESQTEVRRLGGAVDGGRWCRRAGDGAAPPARPAATLLGVHRRACHRRLGPLVISYLPWLRLAPAPRLPQVDEKRREDSLYAFQAAVLKCVRCRAAPAR